MCCSQEDRNPWNIFNGELYIDTLAESYNDETQDNLKFEFIQKRKVNWGTFLFLKKAQRHYKKLLKAHQEMIKKDLAIDMAEMFGVPVLDSIYLINFFLQVIGFGFNTEISFAKSIPNSAPSTLFSSTHSGQ